MRFSSLIAIATTIGALCAETIEKPLPVWDLFGAWPRHQTLRLQMLDALRRGDAAAMEKTCREGVKLLPGDPTWHYNLACALAHRATPEETLAELTKAIDFGFRDANAIEHDQDFARLAKDPRFVQLVARARECANAPVPGRPVPTPALAPLGTTAHLTETNVVFDFDLGLYKGLVKLSGENAPSPHAARYSASRPTSPERPYLAAWLSEGSAAGNGGDLYLNRDEGHSRLVTDDFPLLTTVSLPPDAAARNLTTDHPTLLFPDRFTFANASRAQVQTPFWRSLARASYTTPGLVRRLDAAYLGNQFIFFPANKDYGVEGIGDVMPAAAPFQIVSKGISWSDQPFLRAACAYSAALRPHVKQHLIRRGLGVPTFQWLLRRTLRGVDSEADYLSSKANPTAFDAATLDVKALAERAHALKPNEIPPVVGLSVVNSRLFPIRLPEAGRDYPDTLPEFLFASVTAIGVVLRGPEAERSFIIQARTLPENDPEATFVWKVVHGPPDIVKISTPLGETVNDPAHGLAQIQIDRRALTNRLDVAVFAKTHGTAYGAPSIISFLPVSLEKRVYDARKRLVSIDYSNAEQVYCDPLIALPRRWKDTYRHTADGRPLGFTRSYDGKDAADFAPDGRRVLARRPDGTPSRVIAVQYLPRRTGNAQAPLELTYVDVGNPVDL